MDFNVVERLEKFYGKIPENEKAWINDNIESLTDEQKGKFYQALTTVHEFKHGYPEITVMAEVYKKVMNKVFLVMSMVLSLLMISALMV